MAASGWSASAAITVCDIAPWKGAVWRGHSPSRPAADYGGSLRRSGRYHQATDDFAADQTWPALYTATDRSIAMAEIRRNVADTRFNHYRYTELWIELEAVLYLAPPDRIGVSPDHLLHPSDFTVPRALAAAARRLPVEAMVVPSATGMGDNLIVFPDLLRPTAVIVAVAFVDPMLEKSSSEVPSKGHLFRS